jgi:hypothetical protein
MNGNRNGEAEPLLLSRGGVSDGVDGEEVGEGISRERSSNLRFAAPLHVLSQSRFGVAATRHFDYSAPSHCAHERHYLHDVLLLWLNFGSHGLMHSRTTHFRRKGGLNEGSL